MPLEQADYVARGTKISENGGILLGNYCFYGVSITSQWPLYPQESGEGGLGKVKLYEGTGSHFAGAAAEAAGRLSSSKWVQYARLQDGADYLHWPDLFEFIISADGQQIAGRALSETAIEMFRTYLLGQVISLALLKQGIEPLHSTVVVIDGQAIAILGDTGYGKSTLAAALLQSGASLLTDDLLVVRQNGAGWLAYPGPPRMKLFPEAAHTFLGEQVAGIPMNPLTSKLVIPLATHQITHLATKLAAIYVLRSPTAKRLGDKVTIRKRQQHKACLDLIAGTYNTLVRTPDRLTQQFNLATHLALSIPIKSLSYPRGLARLPEVVAMIQADLAC